MKVRGKVLCLFKKGLDYNPHKGHTAGAAGSSDQGDCATGPYGTPTMKKNETQWRRASDQMQSSKYWLSRCSMN